MESGDLSNRKISEYENKIAMLSQEIERLNGNLKNLSQENEGLRKQVNETKSSVNNF